MQDLFSVEGKAVLVTGGASGIGRMIAGGFVEAGAHVTIASRKQSQLDEAAAELSQRGRCTTRVADLSTEAGARDLADAMASQASALHVLVNNAGANWAAPRAEFPDTGWDKVMNTNVKGPFHLTRFLEPLLEKAGSPEEPASVINIGSIDGFTVPSLETYAYSASKAALHHMTRVLARHLAAKHIRVNAIAPGPFQSKMMAATIERFGDQIRSSVPLGRIGEPDDAAGLAIFLASRASAWLTGSVIPLDGGASIR